MTQASPRVKKIASGTARFSVESRLLRELGERLVKEPEVALVELIKNAYDADAKRCQVEVSEESIVVKDDGKGMTLDEFVGRWMKIGTSSKVGRTHSDVYARPITGEKGIGRFAVRFLGRELRLETIAHDPIRGLLTKLTATFNWPEFDKGEDLGKIEVPYVVVGAGPEEETGTTLRVLQLRPQAGNVDLDKVRTATISVVNPFPTLLEDLPQPSEADPETEDPGFKLEVAPAPPGGEGSDVAAAILKAAVLRVAVSMTGGNRMELRVFRRGREEPVLEIVDTYPNQAGAFKAEVCFFPNRKGTFKNLPLDGRIARTWVRDRAGIAVFDRGFRVLPYGTKGDDWLSLAADTARRHRTPRSTIALKHFPMDEETRKSTQLNYMLRLPYPEQLVGLVQVQGERRPSPISGEPEGLVPAADREGFVENQAFKDLCDVIRGAVEAIAFQDRLLQQEQEENERKEALSNLRDETQAAVAEIRENPHIRTVDKERIVSQLVAAQELAEQHESRTKEAEERLHIMSLLGVVAGFMTHEFGAAVQELRESKAVLDELRTKDEIFGRYGDSLAQRMTTLEDFVSYSQGYIQGAVRLPDVRYPVKPRIAQVVRVFGSYAAERGIAVKIEVNAELLAPRVPVSLYNGVALNLYTNSLKAVTGKRGNDHKIAFRAWNEGSKHYLAVSDTGVGIPHALRTRIFDPLFTTTAANEDPLGSGMGLGLSLVKRAVEAFGGTARVIEPPPGFSTCVRVELPIAD